MAPDLGGLVDASRSYFSLRTICQSCSAHIDRQNKMELKILVGAMVVVAIGVSFSLPGMIRVFAPKTGPILIPGFLQAQIRRLASIVRRPRAGVMSAPEG